MKKLVTKKDTPVPAKPLFSAQQIAIDDFKIVSGSLEASSEFNSKLVEHYELNYDFNMGFSLVGNKVRSHLHLDVKTHSSHGQVSEAKGKFDLQFDFSVDGLKDLAKMEKDGLISVNPDLANAIASVTYSTARGILMARMQNTAFEEFILPVVNPNELVKRGGKK